MKPIRKYRIIKLDFPVDIYNYNVQVLTSIDGGNIYYYGGNGKFCKTLKDAEEYAKSTGYENIDK